MVIIIQSTSATTNRNDSRLEAVRGEQSFGGLKSNRNDERWRIETVMGNGGLKPNRNDSRLEATNPNRLEAVRGEQRAESAHINSSLEAVRGEQRAESAHQF